MVLVLDFSMVKIVAFVVIQQYCTVSCHDDDDDDDDDYYDIKLLFGVLYVRMNWISKFKNL